MAIASGIGGADGVFADGVFADGTHELSTNGIASTIGGADGKTQDVPSATGFAKGISLNEVPDGIIPPIGMSSSTGYAVGIELGNFESTGSPIGISEDGLVGYPQGVSVVGYCVVGVVVPDVGVVVRFSKTPASFMTVYTSRANLAALSAFSTKLKPDSNWIDALFK